MSLLLPSESAMIAELLEMEEPMMLHEFLADCLVENPYPLGDDIEAVVHEMNPITTTDTRNDDEEDTKRASITNTTSNNPNPRKRPKRHPEQSQNHIIAERQRRQTLSERFIALSALLPGLKKVDKTTILGEAINHMKELKERVKVLEDQNARKTEDSIVVMKQSHQDIIITDECNNNDDDDDSNSSTCNNNENLSNRLLLYDHHHHHHHHLPDIEAQFLNNNVLIKINCAMQKGILIKIMSELDNLQIMVISTNSMPFAGKTLDITIMAQTESSFSMRPHDVVQRLRSIFQ